MIMMISVLLIIVVLAFTFVIDHWKYGKKGRIVVA